MKSNAATFVEDLNQGLTRCLERDRRVFLIGEDMFDPYGGTFKATRGLSTAYPDRVLSTPISEASIAGIATGAALNGERPIGEIMFGDFLFLAADQLVNHAAKYAPMYNGQVTTPMVIRTPMGGGRGYGPTHSQSIEKHFLGVPGLRILAPSHYSAPGALLEEAVFNDPMPVLFLENKLLYATQLGTVQADKFAIDHIPSPEPGGYPIARVSNFDPQHDRADIALVAYGGLSRILDAVLDEMAREEIRVTLFLPVEISRSYHPALHAAAAEIGRVLVVEEGAEGVGWSSEQVRQLAENPAVPAETRLAALYSAPSIIPAAKEMEHEMLVSADKIGARIMELLET